MKPVRHSVLAASVFLAVAATADSDPRDSLRSTLDQFGEEAEERAGLQKLTPEERDALDALLVEVPAIDRVGSSAEQYLYRAGWEVIALHGAFKSRSNGRLYQFAVLGPDAYLLHATFEGETLLPGYYLVDKTGSTLDIIAPDGKTVHYWVEKEL